VKFLLAAGFLVALFLLAELAGMRKMLVKTRQSREKRADMNRPLEAYFGSPKIRAGAYAFDSILYGGDGGRFTTWIFNGDVIMEKHFSGDSVLSLV
jgi:hypothetical protein